MYEERFTPAADERRAKEELKKDLLLQPAEILVTDINDWDDDCFPSADARTKIADFIKRCPTLN